MHGTRITSGVVLCGPGKASRSETAHTDEAQLISGHHVWQDWQPRGTQSTHTCQTTRRACLQQPLESFWGHLARPGTMDKARSFLVGNRPSMAAPVGPKRSVASQLVCCQSV